LTMRVIHSLQELPPESGPSVVSVGNFDGVHRAHQQVLKQVVERARALRAQAVAVTFEPHPVRILRPDAAPKLITPLWRKLKLLGSAGLDTILVLPFTRDFSVIKPQEFASLVLRDSLHAVEVHEGANFHFGHKAEGNVERLSDFGHKLGFEVRIYPEMKIAGDPVSSSTIRDLVRQGELQRARRLLGRVFSISATPGRGRGYGHKYTVPTINLSRYEELVPEDGVYVTRTRIGNETFDSVTNIGTRPTFGTGSFAIESHLLNFHPISLTAETPVEICFLKRLRNEIKFPSVEALREQIAKDVHRARRYFRLAHLS
jgi:riboflavin kinase/FMN adenylyltransferase